MTAIKKFFSALGRFLTAFRNLMLNVVSLFFFLFLVIGISSALFSGDSSQDYTLSKDVVLKLNPHGTLVEQKIFSDPLEDIFSFANDEKQIVLNDLTEVIRIAANDDNIKAILLSLDNMSGLNLVYAEILSAALAEFKQTGKPIIFYGNYISQTQYLLASQSDTIVVHPMGGVDLYGFSIGGLFFGEALKRIGVDVRIYRSGKFKAAGESLSRGSMSAENKKSKREILDTLWSIYRTQIENNRSLDAGDIDDYINNLSDHLANSTYTESAVNAGLIDHAMTEVEFAKSMLEQHNLPQNKDGDSFTWVSYKKYSSSTNVKNSPLKAKKLSPNKIAVIVAEGNIVMEKPQNSSGSGWIAADDLAPRLRSIKNDDSVKALVLRLNTGGGGAFASELIREEVELIRKSGKPVVVSMGSVTASGGYWIASAANKILASEATITGSIGVIGVLPIIEDTLGRISIYDDRVSTSDLAELSPTRTPSPEVDRVIQRGVDMIYEKFLDLVSSGRDIPKQKVKEIAQGRVWMADKALEFNLIDAFGSLDDSIVVAAELAELGDDWTIKKYEPEIPYWKQILSEILEETDIQLKAYPQINLFGFDKEFKAAQILLQNKERIFSICSLCSIEEQTGIIK